VDVDDRAPVVAQAELEIAAPAARVWDVLSAIDRWPTWNPDVKEMRVGGPLAPGSEFRWKAGPGTITSTIEALDPEREIGWRGRMLGIAALHVYRLEPRAGATAVSTRESWSGLLPRLLRRPLRRTMQRALEKGLAYLKAEAERS
jgi:hypothetical protein